MYNLKTILLISGLFFACNNNNDASNSNNSSSNNIGETGSASINEQEVSDFIKEFEAAQKKEIPEERKTYLESKMREVYNQMIDVFSNFNSNNIQSILTKHLGDKRQKFNEIANKKYTKEANKLTKEEKIIILKQLLDIPLRKFYQSYVDNLIKIKPFFEFAKKQDTTLVNNEDVKFLDETLKKENKSDMIDSLLNKFYEDYLKNNQFL